MRDASYLIYLLTGVLWAGVLCPETAGAYEPEPDTLVIEAEPGVSDFRPNRFWPVMGGVVVLDVGVMYGLSNLWYGDGQSSFKWYSDRLEDRYDHYEGDGWLDDWHTYVQMDKGGHMFVAWQLARVFGEYGRWAGMTDRQAGLFGGALSALFQSQIEVFDGFAEAYGASRTDIVANLAGGAIGGLQVAYPDRLDWFTARYSYHPSPYYERDVSSNAAFTYLGNVLKDYDGISYWLVVQPDELLEGSARQYWPDWLGLSVGYSGSGLGHPISGHGSTPEHRRQIYLSLDVDVQSLHDWPQPYRAILGFFSFVRIPMPALQIAPQADWHWMYY